MLKKRNLSVHIYDEEEINALIRIIRDEFVPAFVSLEQTLQAKMTGIKDYDDRT